jgi:hypothetical protein
MLCQQAVALGMASDRVRRIQPFDPCDAIVDTPARVTSWFGLIGGSERVERRHDQLDASSAGIGTYGDELVVGGVLHQTGGAREGTTHCRSSVPAIAQVGHEVTPAAKCMPASEGHERTRSGMARPRNRAGGTVTPPAIGALAASVAAVQLGTSRTPRAMGGAVAYGTPPGLDDVLGKIGERWRGRVEAHMGSVNEERPRPIVESDAALDIAGRQNRDHLVSNATTPARISRSGRYPESSHASRSC